MQQDVRENIEAIAAKDSWTAEDYDELVRLLFQDPNGPARLREMLARLVAADPEPTGAAALKIGIARYALSQFAPAVDDEQAADPVAL